MGAATATRRMIHDVDPGVASGEIPVLEIDAPPLNMRGGLVPAQVGGPDYPINVAMASGCVAPLPDRRPVRP